MTLRITIAEEGSRRAFDRVEIPVPVAPPAGPEGGYWKWVGPLPSADVDLGSGLTLVLRVIQTDSVEARERLRGRAGNNGHAAPAKGPQVRAGVRCPKCGKDLLGKPGLAPHMRACDPKPKVAAPVLVSCPTCGKEFDSAMKLGPHRRMAHGYKSGNPRARNRSEAKPTDRARAVAPTPVREIDPGLRELALGILEASHGGPEPVDDARALKIALIIREKFRGSFGDEGAPFVQDSDLDAEERTELSALDGRMIAHRILGRGRARSHFWLFKSNGMAPDETVREIAPGVGS